MNGTPKIAVLGGGSWATAIIKILLDNVSKKNEISWFMRNKEALEYLRTNRRNLQYLMSVELDVDRLSLYNDINDAIRDAEILIFAIPAAFLKDALSHLNQSIENKFVVSAIKGIVPEDNLVIADYFQRYHNLPVSSIGVLTGPCHAEEVALERLSYLTFACEDLLKAETLANVFETHYIKTSISDDIYGTEYSAVLKNIFSVAAGICRGLGYGDNFQAVLISNAIQEIKRFTDTVHPITRDIKSSAYLGDLMVTAYSKFSRNRIFGSMIGKGYSVKAAQLEMNMIAEGYFAAKCIHEINQNYNIYMPISEAVFNILYKGKPPAFEIKLLTDKLR